ncbi:MAG TPA: hypothetical protein VGJ60_26135 [Chloroflexota bacterium]
MAVESWVRKAGSTTIPRSRKDDPTVIPDNPNWHRFKMACPFYRERWIGEGEQHEGRTVLYHVICLQNTPPTTIEEQQECLESRTSCWRLRASRRRRVDREAERDREPAASAVP